MLTYRLFILYFYMFPYSSDYIFTYDFTRLGFGTRGSIIFYKIVSTSSR
nr:MAG TPA: hypothetical protein [Bacteriophage sp.]